jgi:hypothetical protein
MESQVAPRLLLRWSPQIAASVNLDPKRKAAAEKYLLSATAPSSRELHTPLLQRFAAIRNKDESGFFHRVVLNLLRTMCVFSPHSRRTRRAIG